MIKPLSFISSGAITLIRPVGMSFADKMYTVNQEDIIPLIPGFVAGAPYDIFPMSKVLQKIKCNWKIKLIERVWEKKWIYTFEILGSDWRVAVIVSERKKWDHYRNGKTH